MKLQKQLSRIVDEKAYPKWVIVIPPQAIEKVGWKDGEELKEEVHENKLLIRKIKKGEIKKMKKNPMVPYERFKEEIQFLLDENPEGLTWTEIKKAADFPQRVPNNKWVKKLEDEIGLKRIRVRDMGIIWKIE